ncbi:MAG: hypothetical protein J6M24_07205 [Lachnospiraceae bacterium]|nr:hypothetical protein [Lachnospiraceae bacterium]
MNKKAFIGLSVVIDLIIVLIIIAAAVETRKYNKESSSSKDKVIAEPESRKESSAKASSEASADSDKTPAEPTGAYDGPTKAPEATEIPAGPTAVPTAAPAADGSMLVSVRYDGMAAQANAVTGIMDITNNGSPVSLKDLKIDFYLTKNGKNLVFECYHSAVNTASGSYQGLNSVSGSFADAGGSDTDTVMTISFGDALTLGTGDKLTVNFSAHSSDWTMLTTTDDWSVKDPGNIVIKNGSQVICGKAPQ